MTWNGLAHDRQELTSCGVARAAIERVVGADERRVHAVARFDLRAACGDDVQLERFHAIDASPLGGDGSHQPGLGAASVRCPKPNRAARPARRGGPRNARAA